jgi:penicillin-binding protein 2
MRLQLFEGRKYYRLSEENRIKKKFITAPRGRILDRHGNEIANTRPGFYVSIIPAITDSQSLQRLARVLNTGTDAIIKKTRAEKNPFVSVKVAHDIGFDQLSVIEERIEELQGIEVGVEPVRNYPYAELFAHVIGYVGEITAEEVSTYTDRKIGEYVGRMGIEEQNDNGLVGTDGIEYIEVDARGKEIGKVFEHRPVTPVPGSDLRTTLDLALSESTAVFLRDHKKAAAVALDPASGDVLVLYSKPGFDPNVFVHGMTDIQWQMLNNAAEAPMYNRAIMSCYPPGSTIKPFIALAALDAKIVTKDKYFETCRGSYRLGNRVFRCWKVHGRLALIDAIVHSCDVYFYQLGRFIGVDVISRMLSACGFGRKTGVDLPNEKTGNLPDRAWFERRYGKNWTEGHIFNLSIGQGDLLVTAMQLACAYTVFANDGRSVVPRLVRGKKPAFVDAKVSVEAVELVKLGLHGVVQSGTGMMARVENIAVCGKTGTAENPHGEDHSLFVGYAPVEEPKIVVCVLVENAGHGGSIAAPIAGRIIKAFLAGTKISAAASLPAVSGQHHEEN